MFKKVGIISFLVYYLVFMILPNLPLVQYYYGLTKQTQNVQIIANNDSQVLVGDICFLKALVDRTNETESEKDQAPPPKPNSGNTNLVYLIAEFSNLHNISNGKDVKFLITMELLTYRYLQIPSPPPKSLS